MNRETFLHTLLGRRSVQYLLFWAVSFVFLVNYFTKGTDIGRIDIIYTLLFHISLVFAVSVNSFFLVPEYLARNRYAFYTVGMLILLGVSVLLHIATFRYLSDWLFPGYYFISYLQWWEILEFMIVYTGLTSLLEFSKSWFRELEMEKEVEMLRKEKLETELKALRAQINPHFLFNSLNHIYALAKRQKAETADAVLQLSELLRYALQRMDEEKVPLTDEVAYLGRYVELYKSRFRERDRIRFATEGPLEGYTIAPLLLIVFVENCFKHGSISRPGESIDIHLTNDDGTLTFRTWNTVSAGRELPGKGGGLGLENVRRRLNLLYPGRHSLEIVSGDRRFETNLELELL